MKSFYLILLITFSIQTVFAEPAIENLLKMIKEDPSHSFIKGKDFAMIAKDTTEGSLSLSIEKKGSRPLTDFAWSLEKVSNYTKGLFYYNKMEDAKGYMATINFTNAKGSLEAIECFVVDYYICGKRVLEKCTTSKSGYTLAPKLLKPIYDEALYNQCSTSMNVYDSSKEKLVDKNEKRVIGSPKSIDK